MSANSAGSARNVLSVMGSTYTLASSALDPGPNAWTAGVAVKTFAKFTGHRRRFKPKEIVGDIKSTDSLVTMAPGDRLPQRGDRIALGVFNASSEAAGKWLTVISADAIYRRNVVAVIKIHVRE